MTVYKKKFTESKFCNYFVTTDGRFYSVNKRTGKAKRLSPYEHNGHLFINILNRGYQCKNIIAQMFFKRIEKYDIVEIIDGNNHNIRLDNLRVIPRAKYVEDTLVKYQKERSERLKEVQDE